MLLPVYPNKTAGQGKSDTGYVPDIIDVGGTKTDCGFSF